MSRTSLLAAAATLAALTSATTASAQAPIWQGAYVGLHAGGGWAKLSGDDIDTSVDPKGAVGGVHAGYNWQSGSFVFGVEGDASASGMKWTMTDGAFNVAVKSSYIATLRGRVGVSTGPALLYLTGGAAWTNIKVSGSDAGDPFSFGDSGRGWVVGGGMEYAMGSNWRLRLEGLHHRFSLSDDVATSGRYTINSLRAGLSYKF